MCVSSAGLVVDLDVGSGLFWTRRTRSAWDQSFVSKERSDCCGVFVTHMKSVSFWTKLLDSGLMYTWWWDSHLGLKPWTLSEVTVGVCLQLRTDKINKVAVAVYKSGLGLHQISLTMKGEREITSLPKPAGLFLSKIVHESLDSLKKSSKSLQL